MRARKTLTRGASDICLQNSYYSVLHDTAHKTQPRKTVPIRRTYRSIYNGY